MLERVVPCLLVALSVGCGGATEAGGGDKDGSGGAGGTSVSSATNSTVVDCTGVMCPSPPCPDGRMVYLQGDCCPVCVCDQAECEPLDCPSGKTVTRPGGCCAECVNPLCENVLCDAPTECASGLSYTRPDGACCADCLPDEPVNSSCDQLICYPDGTCSRGYVRGDFVGGCCYQCLPDPLYCEDRADCVIADRPRSCCGCPEVVSTRALEDDPCWSNIDDPRPIPEECQPEESCDAPCGACPELSRIECQHNRCVAFPLQQ